MLQQKVLCPKWCLRRLTTATILSFSLGLVWCRVQPVQAQAVKLSAIELPNEAALATHVSFEVKRLPLSELLSQLQKQSGVTLASDKGFMAEKVLVTARIREMPLWNVMNVLSRMYGVVWQKESENSYTLSAGSRPAAQLQLLQTGDMEHALSVQEAQNQEQESAALADEVVAYATPYVLRSAEGMPFASFPEELRNRIRQRLEKTAALQLIRAQSRARTVRDGEYFVRFEEKLGQPQNGVVGKSPMTSAFPTITIHAADGNTLAELPFIIALTTEPVDKTGQNSPQENAAAPNAASPNR